ncbi:MAG: S9 family peptidase [Rhodanobacteraceae bacterium]|nr:MAG: S9 family peptidase [Rhodanobacteraceae bacterium]
MKRRQFLFLASSVLAVPYMRASLGAAADCIELTPPVTPKRPKRIVQWGQVRVDNYAWLKPANWKAVWKNPSVLSPNIRAHLEAENAYATAVLAPTDDLQRTLLAEMLARSSGSDAPPPYPMGGWLYYHRFHRDSQYASWYRKRRSGADNEELLVDGSLRAQGRPGFKITNPTPSPNQRLFAWAEDPTGSEHYNIYVKDLATGRVLSNPIENAYGVFVFSSDSRWIFWVYRDANSRPTKVFRRPAHGGEDVLVYQELDPAFLLTVSTTASGRYVMIRTWNAVTSEVRLVPGEKPTETPRVVEPRTTGLVYSVEDWNRNLIILTNADGATNYKLMIVGESDPRRANWRDWIPYKPDTFITGMRPFREYFLRVERVKANPRLVVTDIRDMSEHTLDHHEAAYVVDIAPHQEYASSNLRYVYQSPRQPKQWVAYDMATSHRTVLQTETVGGTFSPDNYVVERVYAVAHNGSRIPVTVVRHRETKLDGKAPLMMYAYGAYGYFIDPAFSSPLLSLLDRGWIYAIAYVRGGSAEGWDWYLQARQLHKKLSFTDFISCADALVHKGYGRKGGIVVYGFSAGGLVVGAVLNMRPDLFAGAIGEAPFVDMLNTMSDPSHPLVPLTYPDWGNPLASKAVYEYMASYSPYDNVAPKAYPPVLATTSVADDRVGFWEPAKWIAKLRDDDVSHSPKLLRVEMGGHGGSSGRVAELRQKALFFAFSIWAVTRHCT